MENQAKNSYYAYLKEKEEYEQTVKYMLERNANTMPSSPRLRRKNTLERQSTL
jgi:hypothetical protein